MYAEASWFIGSEPMIHDEFGKKNRLIVALGCFLVCRKTMRSPQSLNLTSSGFLENRCSIMEVNNDKLWMKGLSPDEVIKVECSES